jgi:hypothetical protein
LILSEIKKPTTDGLTNGEALQKKILFFDVWKRDNDYFLNYFLFKNILK